MNRSSARRSLSAIRYAALTIVDTPTCPTCGTAIEPDANYCPHCGAGLSTSSHLQPYGLNTGTSAPSVGRQVRSSHPMRRLVAAYTVGSLIVALVGQVMFLSFVGRPPFPNGFCFPQP